MAMKKGFLTGALAGVSVAAVALAGAGLKWPAAMADERPAVNQIGAAPNFAPPPGAPFSFADIYERVAPAVVSIDVTTKVDKSAQMAELAKKFGLPTPPEPQGKKKTPKSAPKDQDEDQNDDQGDEGGDDGSGQAMASGSGFFISSDGYIVTNNHVVGDADTITVRLTDKREFKAKLIGRDEATDLAVIKVEGKDFPFVTFENKAKPRVGDWVIAVGNPFLLNTTATAGIVSAYGRNIGESFVDFLQIDAPINRGNSGGPTFDVYGRVIGVNTAIFSPTGGSVGIGFAIPADLAESITNRLMSGQPIVRGYLGAGVQDVAKEVAESLGVKANTGVLVAEVTRGGPAEKAGVQNGDIILTLNGRPVNSREELVRGVALTEPGKPLNLQVLRAGKTVALVATAGVRPSDTAQANRNNPEGGGTQGPEAAQPGKTTQLGLALSPITDAARRQFDIRTGTEGVLIAGVADGSDAARKGLRPGDVILSINQQSVNSPKAVADLVAAAAKAGRQSVFLLINRAGQTAPVVLKIEK